MKKEITLDLDFSGGEAVRCEMHSFCNLLTVLVANIQIIAKIVGDPQALEPSTALCREMLNAFSDRAHAFECVRKMPEYRKIICDNIAETLESTEVEARFQSILEQTRESLLHSLEVADVRVAEILEREAANGEWVEYSVDELKQKMRQVFDAIARNAGGRYGIVYDDENHTAEDYLICMDFVPENGRIHMPAVLSDTLRDLTANARKYSLPGSRIVTELKENSGELLLAVRDEGRGIPEGEIEKVVRFGVRGSNTTPEETKGGGFGLTKAYSVCRRFGGRMWIESELGIGTEVLIKIPLPVNIR